MNVARREIAQACDLALPDHWRVPSFTVREFSGRNTEYCVVIPVINEGERILRQLEGMSAAELGTDVIIADGGSTDGSTAPETLEKLGISSLLVKTDSGKLSAQLRMGFAYALSRGYAGVVTIDGNCKDGFGAIPDFVRALRDGFGFIQGSRYMEGGVAENTPLERLIAVRLIHAPLLSLAAGFRYTDTTNGFRAFSAKFLRDERVAPFREIFDTYNLHYYLSVRAARLGYRVTELPVSRAYPQGGRTPTKISGLAGRLQLLKQLLLTVSGAYNPPKGEP